MKIELRSQRLIINEGSGCRHLIGHLWHKNAPFIVTVFYFSVTIKGAFFKLNHDSLWGLFLFRVNANGPFIETWPNSTNLSAQDSGNHG